MKLKKGSIPITLGLLLLAAALGLSAYNLWTDEQAGTACVEVVEEIRELQPEPKAAVDPAFVLTLPDMELPDYVLCPEMEMPEKTIYGFPYIGTLSIPALELELPIMSGWTYRRFQTAPCRYQGSAYMGDLILAAHNYPSHFGRIKELEEGDQLTFTDMDGNVFSYQVAVQEILEPNDVEAMEEGGYDLTLFTCTIGGKHRVTVRCERIDNKL